MVNESMAREAFGNMNPIGRQLMIPKPVTIVGIVGDLKYSKLDAPAISEVLIPHQRAPELFSVEVAARFAGPAQASVSALRKRISDVDPALPVYDAKTLEQSLSQSIAPRRFQFLLLGAFAASALLLAVIGVYGVMAYLVAERTREIGLRIALGARRGQVASLVIRESAWIAAAGIAAGIAAALALSRWIATLLYDVKATDPFVFAGAAAVLGMAALAACLAPALRAAGTDPAITLRYE